MAGVEETTLALRSFHTLRKRNPKGNDLRSVVDGDAFFFLLVELKMIILRFSFYLMGKGKVAVGAAVICAVTVCAEPMFIVRHRMRCSGRWARVMAIMKEFEEKCATPVGRLRQVADAMTIEIHAGLALREGASSRCLSAMSTISLQGTKSFFFFRIIDFALWT
uniref:Phosphotransferase n=1 Tax=Nelumbo nucifera TaxID=4432 RepID=A0A822Z2U2_NELNU|nr:TPA_asm: hypothetical protein HUJ06_008662 [Nelumbo nucifera]